MTEAIGVRTDVGRIPMATAFTWRFPITHDGTPTGTPVNLTGRAYQFVIRRVRNGRVDQTAGGLLLHKESGDSEITYSNYAATADAADVAILSSDLPNSAANEGEVEFALWRTDDPNDRPEAYGRGFLFQVAAQSA